MDENDLTYSQKIAISQKYGNAIMNQLLEVFEPMSDVKKDLLLNILITCMSSFLILFIKQENIEEMVDQILKAAKFEALLNIELRKSNKEDHDHKREQI